MSGIDRSGVDHMHVVIYTVLRVTSPLPFRLPASCSCSFLRKEVELSTPWRQPGRPLTLLALSLTRFLANSRQAATERSDSMLRPRR